MLIYECGSWHFFCLSLLPSPARSHFARWYVFFSQCIYFVVVIAYFFCLLHRCVDLALFSVTQYVRFLLHICITIPFSLAFVPITHSILLSDCVRWFLLLLLLLVLLFPFAYVYLFLFWLTVTVVLLLGFGSIACSFLQFFSVLKTITKIPKVIQYFPHAVLFIKESKSYTRTHILSHTQPNVQLKQCFSFIVNNMSCCTACGRHVVCSFVFGTTRSVVVVFIFFLSSIFEPFCVLLRQPSWWTFCFQFPSWNWKCANRTRLFFLHSFVT